MLTLAQVDLVGCWLLRFAPADQVEQRTGAFETLAVPGIPLLVALTARVIGDLGDVLAASLRTVCRPLRSSLTISAGTVIVKPCNRATRC
ncbi:MAG TPA: hypothetical protein VK781_03105 [Solirubrobacteraceae bacterium]|nr:hypothetical protein [Solirubrobacteraceae bacterium]